ncbi:MAG: HD domain-containing protein, partial [Halobacteriales archaeon]
MKTIKDSVHDHIEIDGAALELLETPPVQRLRHIKQLGTAELVYPSANHTRFEHSLGVYHLAEQALDYLGIEGAAADHVRAAAILHDIGHSPYSHNIEALIERRTDKRHEDIGDLLETDELASVLADHDLDPDRIANLIAGKGRYGQLISSELDVDRMDYLVRDAHHTGVPYGTIDHGRLVRELTFLDDQLVLAEGNVQTAESLLVARALMNPTVYNHHAARISKSMLRRASEQLLADTDITAESLRRMDDHDLHAALRENPSTQGFADRIAYRDLYKRAVWAEYDHVPESVRTAAHSTIRSWEGAIAETVDIPETKVIIDARPLEEMAESTTRVVVGGEIRRLGEQSTLVEALRAAQREQWRFGVYTPPAH